MPDATQAPAIRRFGAFEVNLQSGELRKNGMRLRLSGQPFQILAVLLERPGEVVTREELHSKLWQTDTFVDFDHGLNNAVARIREVLDDSSDTPRYVETIPRRGYRFIAPLADVRPATVTPPAAEPSVVSRRSPDARDAATVEITPSRTKRAVAAVALCLITAAALIFIWRGRIFRTNQAAQIHSIAVLPLANLSGDPAQEYFADGMTDELTTALA
jgi:DNA-binding winged helix-turn-helix (wHTH) protein